MKLKINLIELIHKCQHYLNKHIINKLLISMFIWKMLKLN